MIKEERENVFGSNYYFLFYPSHTFTDPFPQVMTILVLSDDHLGPWALNNIACYMSLRYSPVIVDFLLGQMAILSLSPHICPHRLWAI